MIAKKGFLLFTGSIFLVLFLYSCTNNTVFEKSVKIPENVWQINDTIKINANISDTQAFYNIFINIDADESYLTDNLWLFISSESPSGNILNDTVQYFMFDQTGKPYGTKHGKIIKNKFLYKAHILFPEQGIYRFKIRQGMRENDLPEISSAGINIEKVK